MFGYIRPLKGELKVKEYEQYKAVYCGLCHTLKKKYGLAARFIVNFDFTFLNMLLFNGVHSLQYCHKRCIASPIRKKCCAVMTETSELCAEKSIVLTWWKLKDAEADSGFFKHFAASFALFFLRGAYRKASKACPDYAALVEKQLGELSNLEKENCPSLDRTADCFAVILRETVHAESETEQRILSQLLYHIGRWIYITDALDDLADDLKTGSYNPIRCRFQCTSSRLDQEQMDYIRTTLEHSAALAAGAMELLPKGSCSNILENILYLGMPWVVKQIISGEWKKKKRNKVNTTGD